MTAQVDGDKLIAAIRARGVLSKDLRYCAHEAHHALVCGLVVPWTMDAIDKAMRRTFEAYEFRFVDEVRARAVEQIVCRRAGVDCGDVESWAFVTARECLSVDRRNVGPIDRIVAMIERQMGDKRVLAMADAVIALADQPQPAGRSRAEAR